MVNFLYPNEPKKYSNKLTVKREKTMNRDRSGSDYDETSGVGQA